MKVTCGTDIVEIGRIKKSFDNFEERFCEKIFTPTEQNYCDGFKENKYEHYAARFAAKEAVYKALSDYNGELDWKDIEVNNQTNGRPYVELAVDIPELKQIDITLSHCKTYATAYVVATFE